MTKYKEYCQKMLANHKSLFDRFREVHDKYHLSPDKFQEEFNSIGVQVMDIVKEWEDKLCNRSEGSGYGSFTTKLAEKFMNEVRKEFSMIDRVGIVVKKAAKNEIPDFELNQIKTDFYIKKIEL